MMEINGWYSQYQPNAKWAMFPSYPQAEIEEAARQLEELVATLWPLAYRAWNRNGRVAP
jgi:thymidylate synthase (FAD)